MGDRDVAEASIRQTQPLQETSVHVYRGIRTRNPTRRATVDPRLRKRGHWDRLVDGVNEMNLLYEVCNPN